MRRIFGLEAGLFEVIDFGEVELITIADILSNICVATYHLQGMIPQGTIANIFGNHVQRYFAWVEQQIVEGAIKPESRVKIIGGTDDVSDELYEALSEYYIKRGYHPEVDVLGFYMRHMTLGHDGIVHINHYSPEPEKQNKLLERIEL